MPRLFIRPAALRHNLAVVSERCRQAGASCMFVFKEAPLHPQLVADILRGSSVHRIGLVVWPNHPFPRPSGMEIHHVYAPSPLSAAETSECDAVYVDSRFVVRTLAQARRRTPQLRISLEVGDSRDGVLPEELPALSEEIRRCGFPLRGISVNFACLSSEAPGQAQLACALNALDSIRPLCLPDADISAGGTDMLEFAEHNSLPADVREIRCGTGVTLGLYPLSGRAVPDARQDAFRLETTVLECRVKKGRLMALVDTGTFHTAPECLIPPFPGMTCAGASSAYAAFDVTNCPERVREGMNLSFGLDYHALSRALSSQGLVLVKEDS